MKIVRMHDKARVKEIQANAALNSGKFDEYAEPGEYKIASVREQQASVGRPNLTYKLKIVVGFFQVNN